VPNLDGSYPLIRTDEGKLVMHTDALFDAIKEVHINSACPRPSLSITAHPSPIAHR
jgi:hypothetical protein